MNKKAKPFLRRNRWSLTVAALAGVVVCLVLLEIQAYNQGELLLRVIRAIVEGR